MSSDLIYLAECVRVLSKNTYSILGESFTCSPCSDSPYRYHDSRVRHLASKLYSLLYSKKKLYPPTTRANALPIDKIVLANTSRWGWEYGWNIEAVGSNSYHYILAKDGLRVSAAPADYIHRPGPPELKALRRRSTLPNAIVGWILLLGESLEKMTDLNCPIARYYVNIDSPDATCFVRAVSSEFNGRGIPFSAKIPSNCSGFGRADSAVVYTRKCYVLESHKAIGNVLGSLKHLRSEVPLFTKKLASGIAVAEDPGNGMSFGFDRCLTAAEGFWSCDTAQSGYGAYLEALERQFAKRGIDPAALYLNPGSSDEYALLEDK